MPKRKPGSKETTEHWCERIVLNAKHFYEMNVDSIIDKRTWDLPLIQRDNDIFHVFAILSARDHIWVVDNLENKRLIGMITQHDILSSLAPTKKISFFGRPIKMALNLGLYDEAEHVMSRHPITCTPDDKIADVLDRMMTHKVRRLAVVEEKTKKIVGEVSLKQLITSYYHTIKPLYEICEEEGVNKL